MAFITNIILSAQLTNWIGKLLELLYNWIGNFGWTVVVFSIFLKLILSPLDVWQRLSMRKQQKKMAALKPKLEKLERQYGKNPELLKQKQYELQRNEKINVFSSCIPLIVTMVVFFVVFGGFRALVTYENEVLVEDLDEKYVEYIVDYNYYNQLSDEGIAQLESSSWTSLSYSEKWDVIEDVCNLKDKNTGAFVNTTNGYIEYSSLKIIDPDAFEKLNDELCAVYEDNLKKVGWLWVKNVFRSDIGTSVIPDLNAYISTGVGGIGASLEDTEMHTNYENLVASSMDKFNKTSTWDFAKWNGYFILPILSLLTSFLSTFIMQKNNVQQTVGTKEQIEQQQRTTKIMTYMMPIMLAVFSMLYSAAFAIYYFMSNVMSTLTTLLVNLIIKIQEKNENENSEAVIIDRK